MKPEDMVKEINERHNPVAYYRGVPIFVRADIPKSEMWFVRQGTEKDPNPDILKRICGVGE